MPIELQAVSKGNWGLNGPLNPRRKARRIAVMPTSLRIASWNLLHGGHQANTQGQALPQPDTQRLAAARELVGQMAPDILVINEALWCEPIDGYCAPYPAWFGFEHACKHLYDGVWGNVILSRYPVLDCQDFMIHNRGGLLATIQAPDGLLHVGTYHPHPGRFPHNKVSDYLDLLDFAQEDIPLVLCGDFNAISPADQPDTNGLVEAFGEFSKTPAFDVARFVDGGEAVFPALHWAGLRDGFAPSERKITMPTRLISPSQASGMRIDHLWVNALVQVGQAQVVEGPLADAASDHYPLLATVRF